MEGCTVTGLRRDSEQTPQHPNTSPHISHATSAEKHAASACWRGCAADYQRNEYIYDTIRRNSIKGTQINPQPAQTGKPSCTATLTVTHSFLSTHCCTHTQRINWCVSTARCGNNYLNVKPHHHPQHPPAGCD